jgi:hypothetical protein
VTGRSDDLEHALNGLVYWPDLTRGMKKKNLTRVPACPHHGAAAAALAAQAQRLRTWPRLESIFSAPTRFAKTRTLASETAPQAPATPRAQTPRTEGKEGSRLSPGSAFAVPGNGEEGEHTSTGGGPCGGGLETTTTANQNPHGVWPRESAQGLGCRQALVKDIAPGAGHSEPKFLEVYDENSTSQGTTRSAGQNSGAPPARCPAPQG